MIEARVEQGRATDGDRELDLVYESCSGPDVPFSALSVLGAMLGCCRDASRRSMLYDEAARVLGSGQVVSHCMYTFSRDALHDCLKHADHERLEEHARRLEAYTKPYEVGWGSFFCEWARSLSAWQRGLDDDAARANLLALGTRASELGLRSEALRIERALAH